MQAAWQAQESCHCCCVHHQAHGLVITYNTHHLHVPVLLLRGDTQTQFDHQTLMLTLRTGCRDTNAFTVLAAC